MQFNNIYYNLLLRLWAYGDTVQPRGMKVKELMCVKFELQEPKDNIITLPEFKTNIEYAEEELRWYYSGSNDINFSETIKKTWKQFSDDGVHVNSAYGYRIFGNNPGFVNQWEWVKETLKNDRDSRRCVININSYFDKDKPTADFPCTIACQVFIRDNKLYWITMLRSQDIYLGMRNDVYCFTKMQQRLAAELNVLCGSYFHICNSLHIYEQHFEKVIKLLESGNNG